MQPTATDGVAWSVCQLVCHDHEPCKNGWTNRHVVWVVDLGGPKDPRIRWGPDPQAKGQFSGEKGRLIVKYRVSVLWAVQKTAELIKTPFGLYSGGPNEACARLGT